MQHPWWFPVRDIAQHALGNSSLLVVAALFFLFDSVLLDSIGRLIHSKLAFHLLEILGYASLGSDAVLVAAFLIRNTVDRLKG